MGAAIKLIQSAEVAEAVLSPLRLRLLERLEEPGSATSLAPLVGLTRQQANYHLRALEAAGVIELKEERQRGNFTERVYQLVATSLVIAPSALASLAPRPEKIENRASEEYLVALGARLMEEAALCGRPTMAVETEIRFDDEEARGAFGRELTAFVQHLAIKYHSADGEGGAFRFLAATHPLKP